VFDFFLRCKPSPLIRSDTCIYKQPNHFPPSPDCSHEGAGKICNYSTDKKYNYFSPFSIIILLPHNLSTQHQFVFLPREDPPRPRSGREPPPPGGGSIPRRPLRWPPDRTDEPRGLGPRAARAVPLRPADRSDPNRLLPPHPPHLPILFPSCSTSFFRYCIPLNT